MEILPYIQEHLFDIEPILPRAHGFAAFLDMNTKINVNANFQFNNKLIQLDEVVLRPRGQTLCQSSLSREFTATSGKLPNGKYNFNVQHEETHTVSIDFKSSELVAPQVQLKSAHDGILLSWNKNSEVSSHWVFMLPNAQYESYQSLFEKLEPITEKRYDKNQIKVQYDTLKFKPCRFLVRANVEKQINGILRFTKESWGISDVVR